MKEEILEQANLISSKAEYWSKRAIALRDLIKSKKNIVLLGRGTSGNACVFASYLFGLTTGRHPIDFRPWLATQDTPQSDWSDCVVLAYTQSGESTDIVLATKWLKERGASVIAITNATNAQISIAKVSDEIFFLEAGVENAVPATKTYTAQLMATVALTGINIIPHIEQITNSLRSYLDSNISDLMVDFLINKSVTMWLARGLVQPAALDAALKMQETVNSAAFGYSSAEFLHGPIGSLQKDDCVIIFDTDENNKVHDSTKDIINILASKDIDYRIIGQKSSNDNYMNILLPDEKWAKTIVYSFIGQHISLKLAERKGLDPDKPRGLKKITIT